MHEWVIQLAGYLVVGGMLYGGIRADIRQLHEKAGDLKQTAIRAHRRLDEHIEAHHSK